MSPKSSCLALASLTLVACGNGKMADLERYVQRVKERQPGPIEPLPEIERIDTFVFDPASPRDPFVLDRQSAKINAATSGNAISPDSLRRKEELEQFPLDSLAMVGTLEQGETIWALIKTPEKSLFHVRVGNYMGMNNGQITRITDEEIQLIEIVPDGGGGWRERQVALALSK
jgi:type IV pilus assembly protein PilP